MSVALPDIKRKVNDFLMLDDDIIIDVILAITLGSKMKGDPIWLIIIGGSSTGKSELVQLIDDVEFVHPVSTLTENTFLSGMSSPAGEEMSLLRKIGPRGMITMKDYTSLLSMKSDKRDIIIGQLREIYDGHMVKKTGNGNNPEWHGKVNFLAGSTDAIYLAEAESAGMGRRALYYLLPELDDEQRILVGKYMKRNLNDVEEKRLDLKSLVRQFITEKIAEITYDLPELPEDAADEVLEISNFVTRARTPVARNYRGDPIMVHNLEGIGRMSQQLMKLGQYFMWLNNNELSDRHRKVLHKIAFDSIPAGIMTALRLLARYKSIETKAAAQLLNRPTEWVRRWLEELNMLEICYRSSKHVLGPDQWSIKEDYRSIMVRYAGTIRIDEDLMSKTTYQSGVSEMEDIEDAVLKEYEQKHEELFDEF